VLAVQEVEAIDNVLLFAGDCQPTFRDRICDATYPRRAIGVFSYTDVKLDAVDGGDPMYGFRRYRAEYRGLQFQVIAVWTSVTKSRKTSYKQAIEGVRHHACWIQQQPTVILGDFNDNASFKTTNWPELQGLMQPLGLISAYHSHSGEAFGKETRRTYFHRGKEDASAAHLDYCFLPQDWVPRITRVESAHTASGAESVITSPWWSIWTCRNEPEPTWPRGATCPSSGAHECETVGEGFDYPLLECCL
jgi:hypothetical protein